MLTGKLLVQRFYCQVNFIEYDLNYIAMSSLFIACKVEESHRRIRDIINAFHRLRSPLPLGYISEEYIRSRAKLIETEMIILKALGFHVQPTHAVLLLANYLRALDLSPKVGQLAINYLNDCYYGPAPLFFELPVQACAAISLSLRAHRTNLPDGWWLVFDVEESALKECVTCFRRIERVEEKSLDRHGTSKRARPSEPF